MTAFSPPEEDEVMDFAPPDTDTLVDPAYPDVAPESALATAGRKFKASILPAVGTALGGAVAGAVATPESVGLATIPAAIAGGAAGGALAEKGYEAAMGDEAAKQERAQIAVNEQAHPWASTAGGAIPTLLSLVGGGGLLKTIGTKAVAKAAAGEATTVAEKAAADALSRGAAQGLEGRALTDSAKAAAEKAAAADSKLTSITESALAGARMGASETAQRAVRGDDVGVKDFADSMARDAVAFGPFGVLPHVEELGKALGMAIPQAYLSTIAGAAYDSMVHGQPFDPKDIAGKGTAEVVPFALFNAIAHGVQAGQKRLITSKAQSTATTAADSAEAAGMPQTAQALRDLAASHEASAPSTTAPVPPIVPPLAVQEEPPGENVEQVPRGTISEPKSPPSTADETGQIRQESVSGVPEQPGAEPPVLQEVQGAAHEGMEEITPPESVTSPVTGDGLAAEPGTEEHSPADAAPETPETRPPGEKYPAKPLAPDESPPGEVLDEPKKPGGAKTTEELLDEQAAHDEETGSVVDTEGNTDRPATQQKHAERGAKEGLTKEEIMTRDAGERVANSEAVADSLNEGDVIEYETEDARGREKNKYRVEINPLTGKKVLRNITEGSPGEGSERVVNANAVIEMNGGKKNGTLKITRKGGKKAGPKASVPAKATAEKAAAAGEIANALDTPGPFEARLSHADALRGPLVQNLAQLDPRERLEAKNAYAEAEMAVTESARPFNAEVTGGAPESGKRLSVQVASNGALKLVVRDDFERSLWEQTGGHRDLYEKQLDLLFGEELAHLATLSVWRGDWDREGRRGDFRDFMDRRAQAVLRDTRESIERLTGDKRKQAEEALWSAWTAYFQNREGLTPENISQRLTDPVMVKEFANSPASFVMELTRQLVQVRQRGETSETATIPFFHQLTDLGQKVLAALKKAAGSVKEHLGSILNDLVKRTEDALAGKPDPFTPRGIAHWGDDFTAIDLNPPPPPNEGEAPPPPEKIYSFVNAGYDAVREKMGMALASRVPYISEEDLHSPARQELLRDPTKGERLVDDLIDDPRPMTLEESALLRQHLVQLQEQLENAESDNEPGRMPAILDKLDKATRADIYSGSAQGQAFRMRQVLIDRNFDVAGLARRWMAITGKSLTPEEWAHIRKEAAEFKELSDADKQAAYSRLKKVSQDEIERLHQEIKERDEQGSGWLDEALDSLDDQGRQTVDDVLAEVHFRDALIKAAKAQAVSFGAAEPGVKVAANAAYEQRTRDRIKALGALTPESVKKAIEESNARLSKLRKALVEPKQKEAFDKAVLGDKTALKLLESLKNPKPRTAKPADAVKKRFAEEARKPGDKDKFVKEMEAAGVSKDNAEKLHDEALKKAGKLSRDRAARKRVKEAATGETEQEEDSDIISTEEITKALGEAGGDIKKVPVSLLRNAVRSLVASGLRGDEQVMPALTKLVNESGIKAGEDQVRERATDYGHAKMPTQEEPDKSTREALSEALKVASIKRVEKGEPLLKTGSQRDKPHQKLRELGRLLQDKMKKAGISLRTSEQQLASVEDATLTRLRNDVEDLNAQIAAGERKVRSKDPTAHTVGFLEKQQQLQVEKNRLSEILDSIDPAKPMTPEEREKRLVAAAERTAKYWDDRRKSAEWEDRAKPGPPTAKVKTARENAAHMKELFEQARDAARPDLKKNPEALALSRYNRLLDKRDTDLDRRMREKDYSKPVRRQTVLDEGTQKRKLLFERKLRQFTADARKQEEKNQPFEERVWNFIPKIKRAFVLSYPSVLGKLTAAAAMRGLTTIAEELVSGALSRILPHELVKKAEIEGGMLSASGWPKVIGRWWDHVGDDVQKTYKTGASDLDVLYGKSGHDADWWGFFGRIHAMLKAPVKRARFEMAMEKQAEAYARGGGNPEDLVTNELLAAKTGVKAYQAANRDIFLQDNVLVDRYNTFIDLLSKSKGTAGPALARVARTLLPIVKVPMNVALETSQHVAGIPIGLLRLGSIWNRGMKTITPEEAESVMRMLKKGSLGGALMLLGFYASGPHFAAGGFYNEDDRRKVGEPKAGGFQVFGVDVPSWMVHAPAFEVLQTGATFRRALKNSKHAQGVTSAALASMIGIAEGTPFLNEVLRTKYMTTASGREQFFGELAKSQIEPGLLEQVAGWTDRNRPLQPMDLITGEGQQARKPHSFSEVLESGIPGMRQNLPMKVSSPFSPRISEIPDVIQNYARAGNPMPSIPQRGALEKSIKHPVSNALWNGYADLRGRVMMREMLNNLDALNSSLSEDEKKKRIAEISRQATHEARQALGLN